MIEERDIKPQREEKLSSVAYLFVRNVTLRLSQRRGEKASAIAHESSLSFGSSYQ